MNNAVSNMRLHYSSMPKIIAFKTLDGASFWVKNAKKKHLLAYRRLNGNALRVLNHFIFNFLGVLLSVLFFIFYFIFFSALIVISMSWCFLKLLLFLQPPPHFFFLHFYFVIIFFVSNLSHLTFFFFFFENPISEFY